MTSIANTQRRPLFFRRLGDRILAAFSYFSILIAVGGMGWILYTVLLNGAHALSPDILSSASKPYGEPGGGIANALLGTLLITAGATILAVPPALAAGIYLAEYGKGNRLADGLRFCANVLMGLPSIIVGLFVYVLIVVPTGNFSGFAGTVALAIIMFPVIMRTTEDMMAMVPDTLRESALALGMTRMRTTLCIIARAAKNGLATGVLLSLARVSGETAPLLFTALFADTWPSGFFTEPTANIPVLITEYTTNSPFESMHALGWGAALVISVTILCINIATRCIFHEQKH
ncbi:MAG: phosphate ABC transporter permease PstA [Akkermansia sp.]